MRRFSTAIVLTVCVCCLCFSAPGARAQLLFAPPTLTASAGYSNIQFQKAGNLFYDHDGSYLDVNALWSLPVVPVRIGLGLSGSDYWKRDSTAFDVSNGYYPYDAQHSDVSLFEIEPRISLHLGGHHGLFVEPSVGAGLLVDWYRIDQTYTSNGNTYLTTQDHTGAAFEVRPAIQVGYSWPFVSAGVEASYMYATGGFGGLGHDAREGRIGAFVKFDF